MNIVQIKHRGAIVACVVNGDHLGVIAGNHTTYGLAQMALEKGVSLQTLIEKLGITKTLNYQACLDDGHVTLPIHHPDPAHFYICGTGLTHLGSADARNKMHVGEKVEETDSIKMFRWGVEGGKPADGEVGVQPEWFYKGDGTIVKAHGEPLSYPNFAQDGSEEPEVCGIYINDTNGKPHRIGFVMANEYSDHVIEKQNYLYLAHSKLRECSFSAELLLGDLPSNIVGTSSIVRDGKTIWEKEFLSGEDNMSHTIANLEHHHFKYDLFCRPGDLNAHFFGTATLSFADGITVEEGDIMKVACPTFGKSLENPYKKDTSPEKVIHIASL